MRNYSTAHHFGRAEPHPVPYCSRTGKGYRQRPHYNPGASKPVWVEVHYSFDLSLLDGAILKNGDIIRKHDYVVRRGDVITIVRGRIRQNYKAQRLLHEKSHGNGKSQGYSQARLRRTV